MDTRPAQRQTYLDWLRVLGVLAVFFYHTTRFFNPGDWHVKNPVTYGWLDIWDAFAITWLMPILFVVSGISLFYAVAKSGALKFLKDKVLRLAVPLVVNMLTLCSIQVYLERHTHGDFAGTFFQFIPAYFTGHYDGGNPAAGNFAMTGMHLWYLAWLFAFSLALYLPMRWLLGRARPLLDRVAGFLARPGAVLLLAVPLLLVALDREDNAFLLWWEAGWPLLSYAYMLFCGFLLAASDAILDRISRLRWLWLGLAVGCLAAAAVLAFAGEEPVPGTGLYVLAVGLRSVSAWCWVLAFLGLARKYLTRRTPFVAYANEAVLPFYILHQTVILSAGYFVVQWAIPAVLKWAIIAVLSFGVILAFYEVVRRVNVLRVLFGMKWRKRNAA